MAKILILIGGHLCTAPRPQKEASALLDAGHDVTVRGVWFDSELAQRDQTLLAGVKWHSEPFLDFRKSVNHRINLQIRLRSRVSRELFSRGGWFLPDLLGYGANQMLAVATQTKADLTIVHSEVGLWAGSQLLGRGFNVGVDFEDWFSEDLLPEAQKARPIDKLKQFEKRLMRDCRYRLTTSQALADALAKAYQAPKPTVVYNTFPCTEREQIDGQYKDRSKTDIPSLHWFSQTIGPGRGLEMLLNALPKIKTECEVHLRGNYSSSTRSWLEPLIPNAWRNKFFIHPTVLNSELLSRIAEHDIGLALEPSSVLSTNLTISNKLFQYLQAGLAVVATDTTGQQEILGRCPEAGTLIPADNESALAISLNTLLENPERLKDAKNAALRFAQDQLCWERQANTIVRAVDVALSARHR